jgi:hypothetical protein
MKKIILISIAVLLVASALVLFFQLNSTPTKSSLSPVAQSSGNVHAAINVPVQKNQPTERSWDSYHSSKFGVTLQYPDTPYVPSSASSPNSGVIQTYLPSANFGLTIQISPTNNKDLNAWLYAPGVEGTQATYYQWLQGMAAANPGGYVASTTIDGIPAVETGFDCTKINHSNNPSHALEVFTVRNGIHYDFSASDACDYPQGISDFRKMLSTVQFTK